MAGADHPLRFGMDKPQPYLQVRDGLEAVLARPVYYQLAELALEEAADPLGIWSDGIFFPMAAD